jgi:hypothetical protein
MESSPQDPWNEPQPEERQFSLLGLFVLMTILSLALAPLGWLKPQVYAGAVGLAALVLLAVMTWLQTRRAIVLVLWWSFLVLYIAAALLAVWVQE